MKKILFTLVVAILSTSAFAQFTGGVKAGVNFASASGDDAESTDMRTAFHFGVYGSYPLSDQLSIQPELLYNAVGASYEDSYNDPDFGDVTEEGAYKLNYLSIPIMLDYKLGESFSVQVGPQIGFLLSAKVEGDFKYDGGSESYDVDIKDDLKGTDFGLNFGLGYSFGKFGVGARYSLGLSNVSDSDNGDWKNNAIQVSLQYKLFGE